MPWNAADASRHTKKAKSAVAQRQWDATQLAYLAGLIDGEGTISIFSSRNSSGGHRYRCYCPRVNIYNNNPLLMFWLVENFGGKARVVHRHKKRWKPSYIWEISRLAAVPMLEDVLPYLVLKPDQAKLYLKFRETIGKKGSPLSIKKVARRQEIMSQIQSLNNRSHDAVVEFGRNKTHKKSSVA